MSVVEPMETGIGMQRKGYVISDLHLFTRRTAADDYADAMREAAGRADFFVLNGDIFDFRWTTLASIEATTATAVQWLRSFAEVNPDCDLHFVMGNHDGTEFFVDYLDMLAVDVPNFLWYPSHVRIGDKLFCHGDLPLSLRPIEPFRREHRRAKRQKGPWLNSAYQCVVNTNLHRVSDVLYSRRRCGETILRCLENDRQALADGITDVYFGHIHRAFSDYDCGGVMFHNTGAAIRHLQCELLAVTA